MPDWEDFAEWVLSLTPESGGRKALRRRWRNLRSLAEKAASGVPPRDVEALFGKPFSSLDPEQNDLKALVAYAIGKGIIKCEGSLQAALDTDMRADPLHFLAAYSGKTFGEKYAPMIASFWLCLEDDAWNKKKAADFYDVGWLPTELDGQEIRIEIKASSERPDFLFQQIRHPRLSGRKEPDYDLLLCLGVSAGTLEWWGIPALEIDNFADNGHNPPERTAIFRHHGKKRPIWNEEFGYIDEGWFRTDSRVRSVLEPFACDASGKLRGTILALLGHHRPDHP